MTVPVATFHNFISDALDKFSRSETDDGRRVILTEMEGALRLLNAVDGVSGSDTDNISDNKEPCREQSAAGGVLWALDPANAAWATAGLNAAQQASWGVFNVPPGAAAEWVRLGVPPGVACLLKSNKVSPELWGQWVKFYGIDLSLPPLTNKSFFDEVFNFLSNNTTTPPQTKLWVKAGVPLSDIPKWKMLGHTASTAAKRISDGVALADLAGEESPVPGTSYPKVAKLAERLGWQAPATDAHTVRYSRHQVRFLKDENELEVRFSNTGRISGWSVQGPIAKKANALLSHPRYGNNTYYYGRGMKELAGILAYDNN